MTTGPIFIEQDQELLTPTGRLVAARIAELLECPLPAPDDNFFALGGSSMLAVRLMTQLATDLGATPSARAFFLAPTVAGIAHAVDDDLRQRHLTPLVRQPRRGPFPLTPGQRAMLRFLARAGSNHPHYVMADTYRLVGPLDRTALRRALHTVVREHEPLRSVIDPVSQTQRVLRHHPPSISYLDMSALSTLEQEEALRPVLLAAQVALDPTREPPFRAILVRLRSDEHILSLCIHHIAYDGWSSALVYDRLAAVYEAVRAGVKAPAVPSRPQFGDYAVRLAEESTDDAQQRDVTFWREALGGYAAPEIGLDPHCIEFSSSMTRLRIDAAPVEALARATAATPYAVLASAFAIVLRDLVRQPDLLFASNDANRYRPDTQHIVGYLANTLLLRVRVKDGWTFTRSVRALQDQLALNRQHHQTLQWEDLIAAVGLPDAVQFRFSLQDTHESSLLALPGLTSRRVDDDTEIRGRRPIAVAVSRVAGEYQVDWYGRDDVDILPPRLAAPLFGRTLAAAVREPEQSIAELRTLTSALR